MDDSDNGLPPKKSWPKDWSATAVCQIFKDCEPSTSERGMFVGQQFNSLFENDEEIRHIIYKHSTYYLNRRYWFASSKAMCKEFRRLEGTVEGMWPLFTQAQKAEEKAAEEKAAAEKAVAKKAAV